MKKYLLVAIVLFAINPVFAMQDSDQYMNDAHPPAVTIIDVNTEVRNILADLKKQLSASQTEIVSLKDLNIKLRNQLELKNSEIAKLSQPCLSTEQDVSQYKIKITELLSKIGELNLEIEKYKNESALAAENISGLEACKKRINTLNSQLLNLDSEVDLVQRENAALKNQQMLAMAYKKQVDELSSQLTNVSNKTIEKTAVEKQMHDLSLKNAEFEINNNKLQLQVASIVSENDELIKNLSDCFKLSNIDNAIFYYNLGKAYHQMKKYDKAISNYKQALVENPQYNKAYYALGESYAESGDLENAKSSFKTYLGMIGDPWERMVIKDLLKKLENRA